MTKEIKIPKGVQLYQGEYPIKQGFANLFHAPGIADGGELLLTNQRLIFIAHAVNINSNMQKEFDIRSIVDVRRKSILLISQMIIIKDNTSEKETKFVVYKSKEWLALIQEQINNH